MLRRNLHYAIPLLFSGANALAQYDSRVLATNPFAYYKLNEASGTTMIDSSGNGYDGSYSGMTLAQEPFLTDLVAEGDGANDYATFYSAGLESEFDGGAFDEGCFLLWLKVTSAGVWTDGATDDALHISRDGSNYFLLRKTSPNSLSLRRVGNGTTDIITASSMTTADMFSVIGSWSVSEDEFKVFIDGVQVGSTQTGLVAAAGSGLSSTQCVIGANSTSGGLSIPAYFARFPMWNTPVNDDILALATITGINA